MYLHMCTLLCRTSSAACDFRAKSEGGVSLGIGWTCKWSHVSRTNLNYDPTDLCGSSRKGLWFEIKLDLEVSSRARRPNSEDTQYACMQALGQRCGSWMGLGLGLRSSSCARSSEYDMGVS